MRLQFRFCNSGSAIPDASRMRNRGYAIADALLLLFDWMTE